MRRRFNWLRPSKVYFKNLNFYNRYEVYGKDILIANKMESNGVEDKIIVS
jgi:hypothetical protein